MREAFAMQKLLTFFQQKIQHIWDINNWNFNETLTNDVVSFEQPGPGLVDKAFLQFSQNRWDMQKRYLTYPQLHWYMNVYSNQSTYPEV